MRYVALSLLVTLAGCAGRPAPLPVAIAPPPPAAAPAPVFAGYGSLPVPPRLPDGRFATPNSQLSAAGTLWHLRAGLNVAALACRDANEAQLVAGYNALLAGHRAAFDAAYRALEREHGGVAAFDGAMTALYNYYALPPAQPGLCAAARQVLADAALLPAEGLAAFAQVALGTLEQPYTAMFARQEAWLATQRPAPALVAVVAAAPAAPVVSVDPAVLRRP